MKEPIDSSVISILQPVTKMNKDIKVSAATLSDNQARFLVDTYYQMQNKRIRSAGQVRSMQNEPHEVLDWLNIQDLFLENQIKGALDVYSANHPVGKWMRSICGIGPVISAGFLSYIDITRCKTAGTIWRFAGLDPTDIWGGRSYAIKLYEQVEADISHKVLTFNNEIEKFDEILKEICRINGRNYLTYKKKFKFTEQDENDELKFDLNKKNIIAIMSKRPFSANLKVLCWKLGESFVKVSGNENDFYGKIYIKKKQEITALNEMFHYKEKCKEKLEIYKIGKTTEAYASYSEGKLPKGHIHAMSKRYAVKIFLSHLHEVWFMKQYGVMPPNPIPLKLVNHKNKIEVPNWENML